MMVGRNNDGDHKDDEIQSCGDESGNDDNENEIVMTMIILMMIV